MPDDGQCEGCGWVPHLCKCKPREAVATEPQKDPERIEIIEKTLELLIRAILDGEDRDHDSWIRHTLIPTARGLLAMTARRLRCPKCGSRVIDYEINDEDYVRSAKCLKCNYIWEDCEREGA